MGKDSGFEHILYAKYTKEGSLVDWRIGTRAAMEWAKKKGREHRERKEAVRRNHRMAKTPPVIRRTPIEWGQQPLASQRFLFRGHA